MWRTPLGDRVLGEAEWAIFAIGIALVAEQIEVEGHAGGHSPQPEDTFFDRLSAEQKLCEVHAASRALRLPDIEAPEHTAANEGAINAAFDCVRGLLLHELDGNVALGDDPRAVRRLVQRAIIETRDSGRGLPLLGSTNEDEWLALVEEVEDGLLWDYDWAEVPETVNEYNEGYFRTDFSSPSDKDLFMASNGIVLLLRTAAFDRSGGAPA